MSDIWKNTIPSKLNDPTNVPCVVATLRATENPVPKPGVPTSHLTAVLAIHDWDAQIDGCIRADIVQSEVAKLTPVTVMSVAAVTAALGRSKPLTTGAVPCSAR